MSSAPTDGSDVGATGQLASMTVQNTAPTVGANAPSAPQTAPAAATPVAVPLSALAVEISARAQAGSNHFAIRLDPPELGRVDVQLHVDAHGQVTSHLVVDRADTLDLLRRDASDLQRSLQQAGLKTGDAGLQFSLRDQSFAGQGDNGHRRAARVTVSEIGSVAADVLPRSYTRAGQGSGLDIRV